jgi:S-DNA-T family DNA segregation ATPase FtsK/SpoIIIE
MTDAIDEAGRALLRLVSSALLRGAGGLLFLVSAAGLVALASYSAADGSLNHATARDPSNWLGGPGATAADLLLQSLGFAALAALAVPAVWGVYALTGKGLKQAGWRAAAWPSGAFLTAAGLGALPLSLSLPAGPGGLLGLAAAGATHALVPPWTATGVLLVFMASGLTLAYFATGLPYRLVIRAATLAVVAPWWGARRVWAWRAGWQRTATPADEPWDAEPAFEDEDEEDEDEAEELAAGPDPDRESAPRRQTRIKREEARRAAYRPRTPQQPALNLAESEYHLPPLGLLSEPVRSSDGAGLTDEALEENARMLEAVLGDFGVRGRIVAVRPGPVVTLYEFEPAAGVKSSRVVSLSDDVARSMSAVAARIAVIPGRNVLGIELPNLHRETVFLREMLASNEYEKARTPLILALGKTIGGEPVMVDLAKMPHLLIAGTTGSGKSVAINTMILSLLYRLQPEHCRMIMIDPKMLELSVYEGIPHLLAPVVTDPKKAVVALKWAVREMEERYRKMSKLGVRGVEAFNERVNKAKEKGEQLKRTVQTGFDRESGKPVYEDEVLELEAMPYIVVVVDEVADLMMVSGKEIEGAVQRLAQMARAAGIHLIAATQRPSVDVITGTIKANFPTRISFQVTSKIDSRTILGEQGAEQLLGQGDMLHMMAGGRIRRVHGPFVTDAEVEDVVSFLKTQGRPDYLDAVTEEEDGDGEDPYALYGSSNGGGGNGDAADRLYDQALAIVARERKATTSYIQRRLGVGYNRAATLIERMEDEGVISKPNHQGKREVLLPEGNDR